MATRERRRDRALRLANRLRGEIGTQIRVQRIGGGTSLRTAAAAVGMDHSTLGRIERGIIKGVSLEQVSLACVAVGLEPTFRAFPRGDPARDAAHLRLLARFRARLPSSAPWWTEVPMPIPGDLRALDARTRLEDRFIGIEAETQLRDVQAVERRALLKKRDAGLDVLILLVADTTANRNTVRTHRDALRGAFPLDTRDVLLALAHGQARRADGIVVL